MSRMVEVNNFLVLYLVVQVLCLVHERSHMTHETLLQFSIAEIAQT